ncbi:ATP-binding protein [Pseudomonas sp. MAG002Y]|uniref:ATP-binding protein n=1 Tax=Pseudomonas sp. MAG002Y TaxID=2678690 RepID=UPI001C610185|nr:ATP-binding protein [Pseudomonas sp. MAG002Y]MBW5415305.1 kinase [Pseudomonas sp. MAG002Y]
METVQVINPDLFLETEAGRVWTPERSKRAWADSFEALEQSLSGADKSSTRLLIVCGLQGSGKSQWIKDYAQNYAPCVCFDAALPGVRHRKPILDVASKYGVEALAIWIDTPIEIAKQRNLTRQLDKRVPDESIESVARLFEPPRYDEGFSEVIRVTTTL